MAQAVVITSGKGGVGKSTIAAGLACGLARADKRVALIDMDIGLRSLDMLLGMESELVYDLSDVVEGVCALDKALSNVRAREGLMLLPASQLKDAGAVTPGGMKMIVRALKREFEFVLIDCPAGLGRGFVNACAAADGAIIVVTPDALALRGAERLIQLLRADGMGDIRLIVNRVSRSSPVSVEDCARQTQIELLGVIPEDRRVTMYSTRGIPPIDVKSKAGDAITRIVKRLTGERVRVKIPYKRFGAFARPTLKG